MDRIDTTFVIPEGAEVYGSDGEKVGSVIAVQPSYIIVEKGFFFPTDYYIPTSAIANVEDGKVYLNVTKEAALDQGWDAEPTAGYVADVDVAAGAAITATAPGESVRIPVHEEDLTATTRERELDVVRVAKGVVAEERTLEVPVTEERVRVERRAVDRPVEPGDATAFEEGVIEVPIRGEEVELQKRVRVAEEVEIVKEQIERTEQVAGTVRREEVRVSEDVAADARRPG